MIDSILSSVTTPDITWQFLDGLFTHKASTSIMIDLGTSLHALIPDPGTYVIHIVTITQSLFHRLGPAGAQVFNATNESY